MNSKLGLLIREPWISKIIDGEKDLEGRGFSAEKKVGKRILLIQSRVKPQRGRATATISECFPLTEEFVKQNAKRLGGLRWEDINYRTPYAWHFTDIRECDPVVSTNPKLGAVIFVRL